MRIGLGIGVDLARKKALLPWDQAGIVALYDFVQDAGSPQQLTDRVGTNHAALGSTSAVEASDPTWVATGLSFDGTDDRISLPPAIAAATTVTILAVATPAAIASNRRLLGLAYGTASLEVYRDQAQNWLSARYNNGTTSTFHNAGQGWSANQSMLLAVRWNRSTGRLDLSTRGQPFVNVGVGLTPQAAGPTAIYLGADAAGATLYTGTASHLSVYGRGLSDTDLSRAAKQIRSSQAARGVTV